jgi:hypothetical protein
MPFALLASSLPFMASEHVSESASFHVLTVSCEVPALHFLLFDVVEAEGTETAIRVGLNVSLKILSITLVLGSIHNLKSKLT